MAAPLQQQFLQGLGLGVGAAAILFYFWHTETVYQLQQQWLAEQKAFVQSQQQKQTPRQNIETLDLLMKAYAVTPGGEEADIRPQLTAEGHLALIMQIREQTQVDISDLISDERPISAAMLYAALLRLKQQQDKQLALKALAQRVQPEAK